jgi:hypothetical protein
VDILQFLATVRDVLPQIPLESISCHLWILVSSSIIHFVHFECGGVVGLITFLNRGDGWASWKPAGIYSLMLLWAGVPY